MEISRDKTAETEGATSIRLRYSRQFHNGGHAHTIDAEATLAIGASAERREQIIRELEAGVEQLARQITRRGSQPAVEAHSQTPARPAAAPGKTTELPAVQPTAPLPISESMPATPTASRDRAITLPQFLNAIRKRWDMSPEEAKNLLKVNELSGLNYKEAYDTLRTIKEATGSQNPHAAHSRTAAQPVVEAPRQANRGTTAAPGAHTPASQSAPGTTPTTRAPGVSLSKQESPAVPTPPSAFAITQETRQTPSEHADFAGSTKAPLPIQRGVVRNMAPRSYTFEEEENYELPEKEGENEHLQAAESKLEELKSLRNGNVASPERLTVLNNVVGGQISEEQLGHLLKLIWNVTNKKRLKIPQVEALISWAKEDYFADEVESLLTLIDAEEE